MLLYALCHYIGREWSLLHLASSWFFIKVLFVEIVGAALKMEDDCNEAQRMKIIVVIVNVIVLLELCWWM